MPVAAQEPEVKRDTMRIGAFRKGMNTADPANEIDNENAVRIRNMEYDQNGNLITRNGVIGAGGVVGVWDNTLWDQSLWDSLGTFYPDPILSELDFEGATAFVGILYTTGIKLLSRTLEGIITDLTGGLVLPDGVRWYWRIFNGVAIGVNSLTSGDNPIQVVSPAPGTASKLTGAPPGKLIEVWKNRLWIARSDQPNQLQASNIGSHTGWDTDAGANPAHGAKWDFDKDDGDFITGLYAEKERLFVFKRRGIYVGTENPDHPNDLRFVKFEKYSSLVGCLAASTIQPVLDDVFFLARGGIASLAAAQIVADFESAIVSLNVSDIQDIHQDLTDENVCSGVLPDRSQYWLCVDQSVSKTGENITYVFDYRDIKKGITRIVEFDGLAFGTAFEVYDHDVQKLVYLLGCHDVANNNYFIGQYIPRATSKTFLDSSLPIRSFILTKIYDFDLDDIVKYLIDWFARILVPSENSSVSISYYLDEQETSTGTYTFNFELATSGAIFDSPIVKFDDGQLFDTGSVRNVERLRRGFLFGTPEDPKPRKAVMVQFSFLCNQENQGFGILSFGIKYEELSEYGAKTV